MTRLIHPDLRRMAEPIPKGTRSENAFHIIAALVEMGWSDDEILDEIERHPQGVDERYRGDKKRLIEEIRRVRQKQEDKHLANSNDVGVPD